MKKALLWLLVFGFTLGFSGSSMATLWIEIGDAGSIPGSAQTVSVPDILDTILGNLSDLDPFNNALDVDMYRIHIFDPLLFSALTVGSPGLNVSDPQLFLFGSDGRGVFMNDDDESGLNGSQSLLPAGHLLGPVSAGFYYLAIGWWDNEPFGASGRIFEDLLGVAGPDLLSGGLDPVAGWSNDVLARIDLETAYQINLTGAGLEAPEPGTLLLLGVGLMGALTHELRRRKRTSDG